jgi:hypothetical protein
LSRLLKARDEGYAGYLVFKGLFESQPDARMADHLFQPDEAEKDK